MQCPPGTGEMTVKMVGTEQQNTAKKQRRPELEVLRCLAMMMVVVLHFLGKSGLMGNLTDASFSGVQTLAWIIEAFAIGAVNLYMLLSGYLLSQSHFKLSRLLQLLIQLWTYSIGIGLLAVLLGIYPREQVDTYFLLRLLFPVIQEHYWFVTAYVYLYLLLPFAGNVACRLDKKALRLVLGLFVAAMCLVKTVVPVAFDGDRKGYDCLWYLTVFLTAVYIRRFGLPFLQKGKRALVCWVLSCLVIAGATFGLRSIWLHTGSFDRILNYCYDYNHLLTYLSAVCLFVAFLKLEGRSLGILGKAATLAGPCTLGVYLLHENLGVRYAWFIWFGADRVRTITQLLLSLTVAVLVVFAAGVLLEALRTKVMQGLHGLLLKCGLYRNVYEKITEADSWFRDLKDKQ